MLTKCQLGIVFAMLLSIAACSSVSTPPNVPAFPDPPAPQTIEEGFQKAVPYETGTPLFNKIPYLNRLFRQASLRNVYVWDDSEFLISNSSAAISSDGKWLLVGKSNGGNVSLWNLYDPKDCHLDIVPSKKDGALRISADGTIIIDHKEEVVADKVLSDTPAVDMSKKGTTAAWLQFTPDASAFLVFRRHQPSEAETMTLHNRTSGQKLREIPIEPKFQVGAISPDGELLLAAGAASLEYWNLRSGQKVASAPLGNLGDVTDIQCTPDQRFVLLVSRSDAVSTVHVFDFHSLREIMSLPGENFDSSVAISPNGQTLAVVFSSNTKTQVEGRIQIYEIGTWKLLREIRQNLLNPLFSLVSVRFSRDGKSLLALGASRQEKKTETRLINAGLFRYDLDNPNGNWRWVEYKTLPLHPEGKYLLDGRDGSAHYLSPFVEILVPDFKIKLRSRNDSEK